MTPKEKRGAVIGGLCVIGLGIAAIVSPDLMTDAEASGRHGLLKRIVIWAWGVPGGIIAILLGAASVASGFKAIGQSSNEATAPNDDPAASVGKSEGSGEGRHR